MFFNINQQKKVKKMSNNIASIGHNEAPSDIDIVGEKALELYPDIFARANQLMEAAERVPDKITSDEEAGKMADFIKQLTANKKSLNAVRVEEKQPHLDRGRAVDGFFKRYTEKLDAVLSKVREVNDPWIKAKKAEEERIREEKKAKIREEAAEKLRIAEEKAAEAEKLRIEQEEKDRQIREDLERKKREAEEKAEADRKAQQAEIDRLKKEKEDADRLAAEEIQRVKDEAKAEQRRLSDEEKARVAKVEEENRAAKKLVQDEIREAKDHAKKLEKENRELNREIRKEERDSDHNSKATEREAKAQERDANRSLNEAALLEGQADRLDKNMLSQAKKAARVRGEQGSLSTVRTEWKGDILSRDNIDLEALRQHIPLDALERAVTAFVKAGGRELRGVSIYEEDIVTIR